MRRNDFGQAIGPDIGEWSLRAQPPKTSMIGRLVRIEPLDVERHAADLFEAYAAAPDARDWTYLSVEQPADLDAQRTLVASMAGSADPLHHAIIDLATGRAVATAALMRIDPANGVIEIGHIALSPRIQRTSAATEAVYLFLRRVFDELGYRRFEWKCDSLNAPSRRAAERYGFTFEGVFRQAVVMKGRSRDTAWYALTDREWPRLRRTFERWLDPSNFDPDGRQIARLETFREG